MSMKVFYNDIYSNGIIGPSSKMLGPVEDGGTIIYETAPGCWGPMITPSIKDGHEVNLPVAVKGAKIGDSILIKLKSIRVKSRASSSGVHEKIEGRFVGDPSVMGKCSVCKTDWPESKLEGIGLESIKCSKCGASVSPFRMIHGYTMIFDSTRKIGVTASEKIAEIVAKEASAWGNIPHNSKQFSALVANKSDLQGIASRLIPFMGHIGTIPSVDIPASKNAGDVGVSLVDALHQYSITREQLETCLTDAHMDIDAVSEGSIIICPVKVDGGGVYAGDMHAQQGDGEIAGHTTDVSGELTVEVNLIKNLKLEGSLLIPRIEDLPPLARPFCNDELLVLENLAKEFGLDLEYNAPIQVIGTGVDLNKAVSKGLLRAASLFGMDLEEVRNRVTITGGIEIGRLPGVVQITLKVPLITLEKLGFSDYVKEQYKL